MLAVLLSSLCLSIAVNIFTRRIIVTMLQKAIRTIDNFQERHLVLAFPFAVIKRYGDDQAGSQSALLTYYSFLALFPLLMVLTTVTSLLIGSHPGLEKTVLESVTDYFPLLGSQLADHVHSLHKSGLALIVGILFTLYGARGAADAFRQGMQHVWHIPKAEQAGFPKSTLKNLAMIAVGGSGFILASIIAGIAAAAGHGLAFRGLAVAVNVFVLFWVFTFLINFSLPPRISIKQVSIAAAVAAIGLVILQSAGGYILAQQLKELDALYSYFAVALGLLFWIYLQAQMIYYAAEIAVVKSQKLWPRSLK